MLETIQARHGILDAEAKASLQRNRPVNSIRGDVEEG